VLVRSGAYNGSDRISIDANVTVVAPEGAVVDRAEFSRTAAFEVQGDAAPTIRGFAVRDFATAVAAANTGGDWAVRELTVENAETAVGAFRSTGAWTVADLETESTETAIDAAGSEGAWTASGVVHRPARFSTGPGTAGIDARDSTGDWIVADSEVTNVSTGVGAANTDGDWRVEGTVVESVETGVFASGTDGDWSVADARVSEAETPVLARGSTGDWSVTGTTVDDSGRLDAADSEGDWTVADSTLARTEGIGASAATGAWTVRNVTVRDGDSAAVYAHETAGDWSVTGTTVDGHPVGVDAGTGATTSATGAWEVRNTTVRNATTGIRAVGSGADWRVVDATVAAGTGVDASVSTGNWTVTDADLEPGDTGVDATDSTGDWTVAATNVTGGADGVSASGADGDWTVADTTLSRTGGIDADETDGDWTVRNATFRNGDREAIDATDSTGDWSVVNGTVAGRVVGVEVQAGYAVGVDASDTEGDWSVVETALVAGSTSIRADDSNGDWTVTRTEAVTNGTAVDAVGSSGDWTVTNATLRSVGAADPAVVNANGSAGAWLINGTSNVTSLATEQTAVTARGTAGAWEIHRTNFGTSNPSVVAPNAETEGNARRNHFSGVLTPRCTGNVTCANPLSEPASDDATAVNVTVLNTSERRPFEGVDVYLYDSLSEGLENAYDGNERTNASAINRTDRVDTIRSAPTGEEGLVRFNGLDPGEHCIVAVPPVGSPRNVAAECVEVSSESVTTFETVRTDRSTWSSVESGDWSQHQNDPQNTGYNPSSKRVVDPVTKWTFDTNEKIQTSPVVANGTAFVASGRNIYALDAETGDRRWQFDGAIGPGDASSDIIGPAVADGTVFIAFGDTLWALDAETGVIEWRNDLDIKNVFDDPQSAMTVANGYVVIPYRNGEGALVGANASTGEREWVFNSELGTISAVENPPAIQGDRVIGAGTPATAEAGGGKGKIEIPIPLASAVVALDVDEGTTIAGSAEVGSANAAPTVVDENRSLISTGAGVTVELLDRGEATRQNVFGTSTPVLSSPAVDPETEDGPIILFGTGEMVAAPGDRRFYAYELSEPDDGGRQVTVRPLSWNRKTPGVVSGDPAVTDGTVYYGTEDWPDSGFVVARNTADGTLRWNYTVDAPIEGPTAVVDGTIYVGDNDGTLHAISARSWDGLSVPPSEESAMDRPAEDVPDIGLGDATESVWDANDPTAGTRRGNPVRYETTTFEGSAGQTVDVRMETTEQARLYLLGPDGEVLARDGSFEPPEEQDTFVEDYRLDGVRLPADGTYTVIAASSDPRYPEYSLFIDSPSVGGDDADAGGTDIGGVDATTETPTATPTPTPAPAAETVEGSDLVSAVAVGGSGESVEATATERPDDVPEPSGEPLSYVEIEAPDPDEGTVAVSVTLSRAAVDAAVEDPESLRLQHYDAETGSWEPLETSVSVGAETVTLEGPIDGFSLFAVTAETAERPTATASPTASPSEPTGTARTTPSATAGDGAGFGLLLAVLALLGAVAVRRRSADE